MVLRLIAKRTNHVSANRVHHNNGVFKMSLAQILEERYQRNLEIMAVHSDCNNEIIAELCRENAEIFHACEKLGITICTN